MNERPEQPPEGRLIAAALERSGLSIRKAAERAGISYGRWRQVTSGVQHVSPGEFAAVHAPARTLAKMAAVVGVTPEQLETEGQRPDAAQVMREQPATPRPVLRPALVPDEEDEAMVYLPVVLQRVRDLAAEGNTRPDGKAVFLEGGDPLGAGPDIAEGLADGWDRAMSNPLLDPDTAAGYAARTWALLAAYRARQNARSGGRAGALVRT